MAHILIMLMMLIPIGMASSQNITPDDIINFNDPATYTFVKDIGNAKGVEVIMVHFKNAFRGADQNLATVDQIWQVSDTDSSLVVINDSFRRTITCGTPLMLEEGYELVIKSIDIDGNKVYVELSKNGSVVDSAVKITTSL